MHETRSRHCWLSVIPGMIVNAIVILAACGCGRDPHAARRGLDLEPALHGHWSCTTETAIGKAATGWEAEGATEREIVELDRYIDAQAAEKAWVDLSGEFGWTTVEQDPATGRITVELWPGDKPTAKQRRELRLDPGRTTLLERLTKADESVVVRRWNYINTESHP